MWLFFSGNVAQSNLVDTLNILISEISVTFFFLVSQNSKYCALDYFSLDFDHMVLFTVSGSTRWTENKHVTFLLIFESDSS